MEGFENFCKSLTDLNAVFDVEESNSVVILLGMVGHYKTCFDRGVALLKEMLCEKDLNENASAEEVIKAAFGKGLIKNEEQWQNALNARKNCSKTFNQDVLIEIINQIKADFYGLFQSLKEEIEKNFL